jgi:hypothetical protein
VASAAHSLFSEAARTWLEPARSRWPRDGLSRLDTRLEFGIVAKRNGGAARGSSGSLPRSKRRRGSRNGRRRLDQKVERSEAQRLADNGWVEWGGELIWAVGFTSGGAPYGLRVSDFDPADLQAMGLDVVALDDSGLTSAAPSIDGSGDWLRDDDVPF